MPLKRFRKSKQHSPEIPHSEQQQAIVWALRLLLEHGGLIAAFNEGKWFLRDPRIQRFLGLAIDDPDPDDSDFFPSDRNEARASYQEMRSRLRERLTSLEQSPDNLTLPAPLVANVSKLAKLMNLSPVDSSLLTFAVMVKTVDELRETAERFDEIGKSRMCSILASLLGLPEREVHGALAKTGTLAQSGLLRIEPGTSSSLPHKLDLLSSAFADRMLTDEGSPLELLRDTVSPCPAPTLNWSDFEHLKQDTRLLISYLETAVLNSRPGVNILLHGPSGTGKTETARLLAAHLGVELFEVSSQDDSGDSIDGDARMRAHRAAEVLLAKSRAILLFDEAEDIFGRGGGWMSLFGFKDSEAQRHKALLNKTLETNRVPTLWLTNSVAGIDPAFMRRFDMVIEMPIPPRAQRERIGARTAAGMLPPETLHRISACERVSPAMISRAVAVIDSFRETLSEEEVTQAVERLLNNTLKGQGHPPVARESSLSPLYDPSLTQCDGDLDALADGLMRTGRGRVCLYGPPGTGKSAFAHWLAQRMGRPLLSKRVSDLVDKWVGATERNIASAFAEAEQEGAVFLLDEIDSYLQDRRGAQRSWEVTQVNELLTHLERFEGVFIGSTNLMDGLDPAALRRFDLKLRFDYLKPAQAWTLFKRQCAELALPAPEPSLKQSLLALDTLTPGDFAACARRHRFSPLASGADLLAALQAECQVKEGSSRQRMGFLN